MAYDIEQVYFFTGTEEVRKRIRMERILAELDQKTTSITRYDLDITSIQDVITDAITVPFLAETKVIIARNPRFLTNQKCPVKHDPTSFIKYLKSPSDTTILIIDAVGCDIVKTNEAVKALRKYALIIDTQELEDIEYKAWIKRSFAKENIEIREDALVLLIDYVGHNLVRMEQEIAKLVDYVASGNKINESDVKMVVCKDLESNVFVLVKAIVMKDKTSAMQLYNEFTLSTQDIMGILGMISKTFNELFAVAKYLKAGYRQNDIATVFDVSPGRAYYLVRDAKSFKLETLEEYIKKLALLDYNIKSGRIDKNIGLELLLLEM